MSVTVDEILASAETLSAGTTEMDWRNSVSRAYYAAYHRAQASAHHCPDNSHLVMGAHEALSGRFELHGALGAKSISIVLQSMKRLRRIADYELGCRVEQATAAEQVAQCKVFKDRLNSFDMTSAQKLA